MNRLLTYLLVVGLVAGLTPGYAQVTITPQFNTALPVGDTREYGQPRAGYGLEVGYRLARHWGVVAAFDRYRFDLEAAPELLDINGLITLLLPAQIELDLTANSWNGGFRYIIPWNNLTAYVGVEGSTNRVTANGYGLSLSRTYWGIAPVLGAELLLAPRWGVRLDTRLQMIFVQEDIPLVEDLINERIMFVPLQAGVVFHLDFK